jgi:hypothetical protein
MFLNACLNSPEANVWLSQDSWGLHQGSYWGGLLSICLLKITIYTIFASPVSTYLLSFLDGKSVYSLIFFYCLRTGLRYNLKEHVLTSAATVLSLLFIIKIPYFSLLLLLLLLLIIIIILIIIIRRRRRRRRIQFVFIYVQT